MKKSVYLPARIEIIVFEVKDVLTSSVPIPEWNDPDELPDDK